MCRFRTDDSITDNRADFPGGGCEIPLISAPTALLNTPRRRRDIIYVSERPVLYYYYYYHCDYSVWSSHLYAYIVYVYSQLN